MAGLASLSAVALALTLVWASVAKLRRPARTAADFALLGLPVPGVLARAVPAAEIAVATLLVIAPGWGGVAGFVMLAGFTTLLVGLARSDQGIACSCFGASSDEPVSWVEVARNVALLATAALAATIDSLATPALADWITFTVAGLITLVGLALLTFKRDVGVLWSTQLAGEAPA